MRTKPICAAAIACLALAACLPAGGTRTTTCTLAPTGIPVCSVQTTVPLPAGDTPAALPLPEAPAGETPTAAPPPPV